MCGQAVCKDTWPCEPGWLPRVVAWLLLAALGLGWVDRAMAAQPEMTGTDRGACMALLQSLQSRLRTLPGEVAGRCQADLAVRVWALEQGLQVWDKAPDLRDKVRAGLRETAELLDAAADGRDPVATMRGMVVRGVAIPGQDHPMPYGAHVPAGYDATRSWPLFIYVHGGGASEQHRFALDRMASATPATQPAAAATRPIDRMLKIWVPRAGGSWAEPANEQRVFAAIAGMREHYNIDADRIYIQGFSLGGFGAVHFAVRYPDVFAGAGPSGPTPIQDYLPMAENLANLPMFLCHGTVDDVCDVENSRQLFERLRALKYDAVYREETRVAHQSTDLARAAQEAWLLTRTRNPWPEKVVYVTDSPRYHRAYWIDIVESVAAPGTLARVEAERTGPGAFTIRSQHVRSLAITLDEAIAPNGQPVRVKINEADPRSYPWPEDGRLLLRIVASE